MAKCVLRKCCFCVELRTGCFILGYLESTLNAIGIVILLFFISTSRKNISVDKEQSTKDMILLTLSVFYMLLTTGSFVFALVLLLGLFKEKPENLKSYLIYGVFFIALTIVLNIVDIAFLDLRAADFTNGILDLLVKAYSLVVIRSYYYEMLEGET